MAQLYELGISEARDLLQRREVSSVELTRAILDRFTAIDGSIRAFVSVTHDLALEQAAEADRRIAAGENAPLTGIPACIKDVICTRGVRTTCSSRMLENFVPPYDAHVMERLHEAGLIVVPVTGRPTLKRQIRGYSWRRYLRHDNSTGDDETGLRLHDS